MRNHPGQNTWESDQATWMLTIAGAFILCWLFFDSFVYFTCWVLYWLWMIVDFQQIHPWVASKINLLANLANRAKMATFQEWLMVMNQTSGILFVGLLPLVFTSGFGLAQHPRLAFRSKRLINIHTLPQLVSSFAPAVIPVLAASGRDGLMNDTSAENAWALKPEEFAERHALIDRRVLNEDRARAVFEAQLGPQLDALEAWQPHEKALLTVFGLQVFLDDRKAAMALLDDLNRSCMIKGLRRRQPSYTPLYTLADKGFARVQAAPGVREWLATHGFRRSALAGLYGRDLRLPGAKFRWLKGVDRTLWYGLHSADTAKVFVEGAGITAQARAESHAKKLGLPRPGQMVDEALRGLQAELESIGQVHPREEVTRRHREVDQVESIMDAAYSVDPIAEAGQ